MDALLLSLMLCLLVELNGALACHYVAFSVSRASVALVVLAAGAIAISALAAAGGAWLRLMLTPEARALFLAFALAMAGTGLFFRPSGHVVNAAGNNSPLTALIALFATGAGSNTPLLIAAIACWFADPWLASIGGGLGCIMGCIAGRALLPAYLKATRFLGYATGSAMWLAAFLLAMSALRLI